MANDPAPRRAHGVHSSHQDCKLITQTTAGGILEFVNVIGKRFSSPDFQSSVALRRPGSAREEPRGGA